MFKTKVNGLLGRFGCAVHRAGTVQRLLAERTGFVRRCTELQIHAASLEKSNEDLVRRCAELQTYAASLEKNSQDLARRNEALEARIRSVSTDLEAERVRAEFAMQRLQSVREQEAAA